MKSTTPLRILVFLFVFTVHFLSNKESNGCSNVFGLDMVQSALNVTGDKLIVKGIPNNKKFNVNNYLRVFIYNSVGSLILTDSVQPDTAVGVFVTFDAVATNSGFVLVYRFDSSNAQQLSGIQELQAVHYKKIGVSGFVKEYDISLPLPGYEIYTNIGSYEEKIRVEADNLGNYYIGLRARTNPGNQLKQLLVKVSETLTGGLPTALVVSDLFTLPGSGYDYLYQDLSIDTVNSMLAIAHSVDDVSGKIQLIDLNTFSVQNNNLTTFPVQTLTGSYSYEFAIVVNQNKLAIARYVQPNIVISEYLISNYSVSGVSTNSYFVGGDLSTSKTLTIDLHTRGNSYIIAQAIYIVNAFRINFNIYQIDGTSFVTNTVHSQPSYIDGSKTFINLSDIDIEIDTCSKVHYSIVFSGDSLINNDTAVVACTNQDYDGILDQVFPIDELTLIDLFSKDSIQYYDSLCNGLEIVIPVRLYDDFTYLKKQIKYSLSPSNPANQVQIVGDSMLRIRFFNPGVHTLRFWFAIACDQFSDTMQFNILVHPAIPTPVFGITPAVSCAGALRNIRVTNANHQKYLYAFEGPNLNLYSIPGKADTTVLVSNASYYRVYTVDNQTSCLRLDSVLVKTDTLSGSISASTTNPCRGRLINFAFNHTNPLWNQVPLTYTWTFPALTYSGSQVITQAFTQAVPNIYFETPGPKTVSLTVQQGNVCLKTFTVSLTVSGSCCTPMNGTINGLSVDAYFGTSTGNLLGTPTTNTLVLNGGTVVFQGNFRLRGNLNVIGPGQVVFNEGGIYVEANTTAAGDAIDGAIFFDPQIKITSKYFRFTSFCNSIWRGIFTRDCFIDMSYTELSHSLHGIVMDNEEIPDSYDFNNSWFYNNINCGINEMRGGGINSYFNVTNCRFSSDPTLMRLPYRLSGSLNNGTRYSLAHIRVLGSDLSNPMIYGNQFSGAFAGIVTITPVNLNTGQNVFREIYRKGVLAREAIYQSEQDSFFMSNSTQVAMPAYPFNGLYDPQGAQFVDIETEVRNPAHVNNPLLTNAHATGISSVGVTTVYNSYFIRSSFLANSQQTGIETGGRFSLNNTIQNCHFENLMFGIRTYTAGDLTTNYRANTLKDNTYGMHFTGGWLQPTGYNPILNCNQFEKTTPGLPFAYGIYVDSLAGMLRIGGTGNFPTPLPPSGNGWVGLSPTNSGYAVWNHPNNVLLDYFAYNNEGITLSAINANSNLSVPQVPAVPFYIPGTTTPDPNATCIDNPAVVFLRSGTNQSGIKAKTSNNSAQIKQDELCYVFPNPVSDLLTISSVDLTAYRVEITDALGKNHSLSYVISKSGVELDVSSLTEGMYFIQIVNSNDEYCRKSFIVKR